MARASRSKRARRSRIGREFFGQQLDGDGAVEARVSRSINLAHSPGTDPAENFIRTEPDTGRERHAVVWPGRIIRGQHIGKAPYFPPPAR